MRKTGCLLFFVVLNFSGISQVAIEGSQLPVWQYGYLDIHHINTGRGSAAFFIFPDGTTLLFDAGEIPPTDSRVLTPRNSSIKPNNEKKPYEWLVHYIWKQGPDNEKTVIDYAITSHFHDDHFGSWYSGAPVSKSGNFILSGITGVGEHIAIKTLIDRAAPNYNYPVDFKKLKSANAVETAFDKTALNYFRFIEEKSTLGMQLHSLKVGSNTQIVQKNYGKANPAFYVRNVKANGMIWTGNDSSFVQHFPDVNSSDPGSIPDENSLSIALTFHYGPFAYYTGGDNAGNIIPGDSPLKDVETRIADAIGVVDVATMDHHGNRDAVNEHMVRTLKPSVWIGQSWSSDHPGHEVLLRITNKHLYPEPRDLFATNMLEANKIVIGPLIDRSYKSQQGHIVVRVLPGGAIYYVIILDDTRKDMPVKSIFGPYTSRSSQSKIKTR